MSQAEQITFVNSPRARNTLHARIVLSLAQSLMSQRRVDALSRKLLNEPTYLSQEPPT